MNAARFLDRLYAFLSRRPVYHALFWAVLYLLLVANGVQSGYDWPRAALYELVSLFFYAVLVYANLFYLIPNYLAKRSLLYLFLVLLAAALVTPIKVLVFYLFIAQGPYEKAQVVADQLPAFIGHVTITFLSTILRVIMDWWRYQAEKQLLLTQSIQSELRFLKSQINPHFLFNTLNNLYALTLQKSDKAPEIVLKLSEIMRYMLYECNERRVLLSREIQYMQNYLDLERIRQPRDAEVALLVEGNVSDQTIAPLIFVPFLENAFKHGLNHHIEGGGFVRVHLIVQDLDMQFVIENSKVASVPRQHHPRSGGIGLNNIRSRLRLLYPEQHELTIEDEPNRYAVTLLLNLNP